MASTSTTLRKRLVVAHVDRCPLTDVRAPSGVVPRRPALLVKIGNEPGPARPQSGLNEADVVFDTPAEGFIMRYMAVYQCADASMIGPLRSVRWVDYHLAPEFGHPILAFAGGIDPNLNAVASQPSLSGVNLLTAPSGVAYRTTNRVPPDNFYTSTKALFGLFPALSGPVRPIFRYSSSLPTGARPVSSVELDFSQGTDVVWQWQHASGSWLHTYSGSPDIDAVTGQPVTATNVVVETVPYTIGPYVESRGGTGDVQSETIGAGTGYVLRDGQAIAIRWHRGSAASPATFSTLDGKPVGLAPGRTWVEIMTNTQAAGGIHLSP